MPRQTPEKSRHVSIRLSSELFSRLELLASDNEESVSQVARRLLGRGLEPPSHQAIDDAITTLLEVRRQLPPATNDQSDSPADTVEKPRQAASRTVDILNAKTDLQRLIGEVAKGREIVITHAGAPRARLVPVAGAGAPQIRNR